jgi:hypothetical protein
MADMLAAVRRFNRTVTQQVGALDDRFLARDRPLAAARLLWEIGTAGAEVRALRIRLGLDSGHLSHRSLTEATALYRSAGYREIGAYNDNPYAHHWFEKHLG